MCQKQTSEEGCQETIWINLQSRGAAPQGLHGPVDKGADRPRDEIQKAGLSKPLLNGFDPLPSTLLQARNRFWRKSLNRVTPHALETCRMTDVDASRRHFIAGAALATAAAASPAAAQDGPKQPGAPTAPAAADYPKPPFPVQQQPWPGLASQMSPRPDHGETSYRGSGRLAGKRALITGGDSGIGRAAAIAYAREGADVAINYLPAEEPDAREVVELIRAAGRKAVAIPGDLRDEAFCQRLVEDAGRELGGVDILVNNAARQQTQPAIAEISSAEIGRAH